MTVTTVSPSPIAGVSPQNEAPLEFIFPGVACNPVGRLIGSVMGSVQSIGPLPVRMVMLLIVGGIVAPIAALLYFWVKILGNSYTVTNHSVQERSVLWNTLYRRVELADVGEVQVDADDSQQFHQVGDVRLLDARGGELITLNSVGNPKRVAHLIIELRDARQHAVEALKHIKARG
ncbi:MAG: hypothetical protein R3C18_16300 [Planctomycetaceae bacterium]